MEQKTCFILMPFTKTDKLSKGDLDYIYDHIIKKAIEEFQLDNQKFFSHVERFNNKVGSIISGIVNNLNSAELVIADLSGLNPNVMYELGVRHSLRRGTIIISQDLSNLPTDLRDYLTVEYTFSSSTTEQPANYERFKNDLHKSISEVLTTNKYDSPVLSYLQQKQRFRDEDQIEKLKDNAVIILAIINLHDDIWDMIEDYEKNGAIDGSENLTTQLFNLKLNNLNNALNELHIHFESSAIFERILTSTTIISELMKMFSMHDYLTNNMGGIPDIPDGVLGKGIINQFFIDKPMIDLFSLLESKSLVYTSMKKLFMPDGQFSKELLKNLDDYWEKKARSLGLDSEEIDEILNR